MKDETIGVVFLHHRTDAITRQNLESFRIANPGILVVTMSADVPFNSGYSIRDFPSFFGIWRQHISISGHRRRSTDLLLYTWYNNKTEQRDRWLIVEWDSFCAMSVADFLEPVSAFDVVAPTIRLLNREPAWFWFRYRDSLPSSLQPYAMGIVPFCFILVSDTALAAICDAVLWDHLGLCNSELRFASIAHSVGYTPCAHPLAGANITWRPLPKCTSLRRGMWHPVKWLIPATSRDTSILVA